MTGIGIKVSAPFLNNQTGSSKLNDLKSHMLGWYDVKRQGCTNESLAENPVLEDLSGNNHPLKLKNFAFGGLSGMGGYGTDLTKWVGEVSDIISYINKTPHKLECSFTELATRYNINQIRLDNDNKWKDEYFIAKLNFDGYFESSKDSLITFFKKDMPVVVFRKQIKSIRFIPQDIIDGTFSVNTIYTLEILPNFPNSLVFNGVTPEYVINKDNVTLSKVATAIGLNKFKLPGLSRVTKYIRGNAGQPLDVTIPSFMVRATGIKKVDGMDTYIQVNILDNVNSGYKYHLVIRKDGTYIIPQNTYTIEPISDTFIPIAKIEVMASVFLADNAYELEVLPNYPVPTTKMYGIIPTLTHGAKCMMMDFVPTYPINHDGYISYYTQRQIQAGANYALMLNNSRLVYIAYNNFNSNGTYINGQLNNKLKHTDLLNKRQVVSVNANEVYEMPANRGVVIATDETLTDCFPTMALNSLILFDRELTEEEMKLVMDKLMKYEDTDNIAGDLSRSARAMVLDDSDMYEEYDVYEDEQEIIEAPTEFNDNTV